MHATSLQLGPLVDPDWVILFLVESDGIDGMLFSGPHQKSQQVVWREAPHCAKTSRPHSVIGTLTTEGLTVATFLLGPLITMFFFRSP